MTEKYFKSRIVHKHDIAENWLKATTFIPLKGELVVYDIDETHSYERFKIGDGKTLVNDLPFADDALKDFINNTYATKTAVNSAINNVHTHTNKSVLDGITSTQVSNWNAAEQNAKNYASNLNSSMDSRVQALESKTFTTKIVDSLPEEGKANTLYFLKSPNGIENNQYEEYLYVNNAKSVPNDGTLVEDIHFNTTLSISEVIKIMQNISGWMLIDETLMLETYFIVAELETPKMLAAFRSNGIYGIADYSYFTNGTGNIYFASSAIADFGILEAGWQGIDFYNVGATTVSDLMGIPVGTENDKLIELVRIESKCGTLVPNDGSIINTVYFNTSLTKQEVVEIIENANLPFVSGLGNLPLYCICFANNIALVLGQGDGYYTVDWMNFTDGSTDMLYDSFGHTWRTTSLDFNGESITEYMGMPLGTHNDKLVDLISITPNFGKEGEWEKLGPSLEGYATEEYVDNAITNIPGVDLSDYATKDEIPSLKLATISLPASSWVGNASPYSQVVSITGATQNSKIDLQPTIAQLSEMILNGLSMQAVNENGVVTVYVAGGKPTVDYSIQALITEVEVG